MWGTTRTSQCPKCKELTFEFNRHFAGSFLEESFPVVACYCPACDHIVVEAYHSKEDRDVVIGSHDSDWRVTILPPPRPHPAFDAERISFRAVLGHSRLELRRTVRQQIGPIVRPDDPELELSLPKPIDYDVGAARSLFDKWLRNAKAGTASKLTEDASSVFFHLTLTNEPAFQVQLTRLRRRFPLPERMTLYRFNDGRKYATQIHA